MIVTAAGTGIPSQAADSPPAQLGQISSLSIAGGSIYLAEQIPSPMVWYRIRRLTAAGTLELVAGTLPADCSKSGGNGDGGPALAAEFCGLSPLLLAFDNAANLYIADGGAVRRITTDGIIHPLANAGDTITALAVKSDGTVDVATGIYGGYIKEIASNGSVKTLAGAGRPAVMAQQRKLSSPRWWTWLLTELEMCTSRMVPTRLIAIPSLASVSSQHKAWFKPSPAELRLQPLTGRRPWRPGF
jgi:hypothetical protein